MQSIIPPGNPNHTMIAGKAQGFQGLAINYDQAPCGNPVMRTAWEPTPAELQAMLNGAPIIVEILGLPPIRPMMLSVGVVPSDA